MEPMTLWQFYAVFLVMCVVGVGLCVAMFYLSARNPLLGHKSAHWAEYIRYKLMIGFLILAAVVSYGIFEDISNAFTHDLTDVVVDTTWDVGEKIIKGESIQEDINVGEGIKDSFSGTIWGEYDESQKTTLIMMSGFWFFLSWCVYVGNFAKSPSSWWQKLCKIIGYPFLTLVIFFFPLNVHYFNRSELMTPLVFLIIAGVFIFISHDYTPRPPKIPV